MGRPSSLSAPASELVLRVLHKAKEPMTAYMLLEKLKKNGINSAPIVYRALDVLMKNGKAHKINELNAFVACECEADHHHALSVLTICQGCKKVSELHNHDVIHHIEKLRSLRINLVSSAVIELPITCETCMEAA